MATTSKDIMFGQCRCCLEHGNHKNISGYPYYKNGGLEAYRDLFEDCFNIRLSTNPHLTSLICKSCILRLKDAVEFKTMVANSEQKLLSEIAKNKTVFVNVPETTLTSGVQIKPEVEMKEEWLDVRYDDSDNEETEVDHKPPPHQISIYIEPYSLDQSQVNQSCNEDLVEGEAELISRYTKQIRPLPTRESLYTIAPDFVSHLDRLKDKNITAKMVEKLLDVESTPINDDTKQISYSEKAAMINNSAMLLENSNLTPFKSKGRIGFPCFYCRHSFENLDKIREHQVKSHKKSELRSILRTLGAESLIVYVDTKDLKCTICDQTMTSVNDLKSHLINVHKKPYNSQCNDRVIPFQSIENNEFICQICTCRLETFGSMERHMNNHYRNYVCHVCGTGFVTKYRLKVHVKSMHVDGAYPCEQCKKVFNTSQKLKNHVDSVHKLVKRFKCPKCSERFTEYFRRQKHLVEQHGVTPLRYKCNVCDKSFDRRYTLSRHMKRDHLEERDFQCEMCAYTCFTSNELRFHMIKHNGERIHECAVCNKAYARKKTLREHMRIHNNDRRFACAVCGQAFVQKCSLKGHMKTHHSDHNPNI